MIIISNSTMVPEDDRKRMINERLIKFTGLYQLLCPSNPKLYGLNAFGWLAVAELVCLFAAMYAMITSIFYTYNDVNKIAQYVLLIVACTLTIFKLYRVMRHSDAIWTCLQGTRTDCLLYGRHRIRILNAGRAKSRSLSLVVSAVWMVDLIVWMLSPFFLWGRFTEIRFQGGGTPSRYRMNVLDFVFPVSGDSYDKYFASSYLAESVSMSVWAHATLTFDVLVISLCTAFTYQLKTLADSFAELGDARESSTRSKS